MRRDIIFRGRSLENNEWVFGDLVHPVNNRAWMIIKSLNGCISAKVDPSTVCQYTGITDEDSTKIWEKDICEVTAEEGRFLVEWDDETARFVLNGDGVTIDFDNISGQECVVVGNCFNNPELLELEEE